MRRVPDGLQRLRKLWFALGRLGTLLLALACWLVWQRFGTLDFAVLNGHPLGNDVWLLGVLGFGLLAGIIPLHGWCRRRMRMPPRPPPRCFLWW